MYEKGKMKEASLRGANKKKIKKNLEKRIHSGSPKKANGANLAAKARAFTHR